MVNCTKDFIMVIILMVYKKRNEIMIYVNIILNNLI